jgi:hypothetical protein
MEHVQNTVHNICMYIYMYVYKHYKISGIFMYIKRTYINMYKVREHIHAQINLQYIYILNTNTNMNLNMYKVREYVHFRVHLHVQP